MHHSKKCPGRRSCCRASLGRGWAVGSCSGAIRAGRSSPSFRTGVPVPRHGGRPMFRFPRTFGCRGVIGCSRLGSVVNVRPLATSHLCGRSILGHWPALRDPPGGIRPAGPPRPAVAPGHDRRAYSPQALQSSKGRPSLAVGDILKEAAADVSTEYTRLNNTGVTGSASP
jgi:hypothetical protein